MIQKHNTIPQSPQRIRFSKTAVGLLAATIVMACILVFSTVENINRAQSLMEQFLVDKGEAIMRSIEAGSRTTMMMHQMRRGDSLHTLLTEYAKDQDIRYISITGLDGGIVEHIGPQTRADLTGEDLDDIKVGEVVTRLDNKEGVFGLFKKFQVDSRYPMMHMQSRHMSEARSARAGQKILSVGLDTHKFDSARQQDVRHALFMGAILFLVSTAGLYFLFLYQKMRITSSKLANMKLYTENVIESIPVGMITLDAADQVVSCNKNTEELFGYPLSILQGQDINTVFPGCSTTFTETCDGLLEYESECADNTGKIIPLHVSCSPLVGNDNENIGKVLIIRDMSSIKEMELQLERSRRMAALGKMAAGIAHEIRNPLGTLRGFAQFFGNQPETSDDGRKYSRLMISEIDRLNQTISGLLQFSRSRHPQFQEVAIDALFHRAISMMESDVAAKNVDLRWHHDTGISLRADPDQLLQVLMNLLKNSINAIPPRGRIALQCIEEDHFIKISVEDNGCGMSEDVQAKMFDPFFTTNQSGTGLGLAVSHQIIEQHGGSFEVQAAPKSGATISFRLPK
ncbi:MAG: nitrogen regulation protein NR(II) [Desulfopila sp.]